MPITRGNKSSLLNTGVNGGTLTWSSNPVAGQKIIIGLWTGTVETGVTLTDNGVSSSTYWLDLTGTADPSGNGAWYIYRADGITLPASGSYEVTITGTGGSSISAGGIAYSGVAPGPPTIASSATGSSDSVATNAVAPYNAGALFFAGFEDESGATETITLTNANFTDQFTITAGATEWCGAIADYIDSGGPANTQCTWTLSDAPDWSAGIAAYDANPLHVVQTGVNSAAAATVTVTLGSATTAGNTLIAVVSTHNATTNAFPDSLTLGSSDDNWEYEGDAGAATGAGYVSFWSDVSCLGGQTTVTVTTSGGVGTAFLAVSVYEIAGLAYYYYELFDQYSEDSGTGTAWTSGASPGTGIASEIFIGGMVSGSTTSTITGPAAATGWTNTTVQGSAPGAVSGYFVQTNRQTATYAGSMTASNTWVALVITFLPTTGPGIAGWTAGYGRDPIVYAPGPPALAPLPVDIANTAGNTLIAFACWRQDIASSSNQFTEYIQYPSTVSVSDDAGNFWIPVGVTQAGTGTMRSSIWMAPAARAAQQVFFSPTAYQAGLSVQVIEMAPVVPWYQIEAVASSYANYGTNVSLSVQVPANVCAFGTLAWDYYGVSYSYEAINWINYGFVTTNNGVDYSGDCVMATWVGVGNGLNLTLDQVFDSPCDSVITIVTISGISNPVAYPYGTPKLENWPVLVTETASGPVLNADPVFALGTTHWEAINGTATAVTWPLFQPVPTPYQPALYGSLLLVPSNQVDFGVLSSSYYPVTAAAQYTAVGWFYSPAGFGQTVNGSGAYVQISWYTSDLTYISNNIGAVVVLQPGEWTQVTLPPALAPPEAAQAQVYGAIYSGGGNLIGSGEFYVGYLAFSAVNAYEATPPDELSWTDISSRVFTQGQIQVTRGIQFEQQSLEAGTMTIYAQNNDGAFTYGNVLSPYWPNIGDTDVPIRLRAINPGSLTPYSVLFSGYTDQITFGIDGDTYYGYAQIQASDAWSRLTQQMLAVVENEALYDSPIAFISCNQTGANTISTGPYSVPVQAIIATGGQAIITAYPTSTFTGGAIDVLGATGLSCWQSGGTQAAQSTGQVGYCLAWLPTQPVPVSNGITIEFWYCPVSYWSDQANTEVIVCEALGGQGTPLWQLVINNTSPAADSYQSYLVVRIYTGSSYTAYTVGTLITFFSTSTTATANYYIVVAFDQSQVTVTVNPGDPEVTETLTETGQSLYSECSGFSWGGDPTSNAGFGDTAIADIAIFDYLMPPARSAARYFAGLTAFDTDSDNWRLARVTGYAGFVPVLGMRGLDLPEPPVADVDIVTGATDTNTQVVNAYFTNEAQTTLAVMYTNGAGTLAYRRRDDWYNRPVGQYVLGEQDYQFLSLGVNPLNTSSSQAGWVTGNDATAVSLSQPAGGPLFVPWCVQLNGNGTQVAPYLFCEALPDGGEVNVTAGAWYQASFWMYTPVAWSQQVYFIIEWYNSVGDYISGVTEAVSAVAGSIAYGVCGPVQAPTGATLIALVIQPQGTPPATTPFYIADVQVGRVNPDYAGGAGVAVPEAPYAAGYQIVSDRAELYNYAQLTQYGTDLVSSFSGTSVLFTPTSGVVVTIQNPASVALRGQVPYTATVYLNNTAQATPYYLNEGSMEDFGNWIVETLGSPLVRPDQATLTPAATPGALSTGVLAEVGDTVVFRRRPLGAPVMQYLTFLSQITQTISIESGTWTTQYQLSPFPGGTIIACDDVVQGVLTGVNLFGW